MKYELLELLICPTCQCSLELAVSSEEQGQVKEGMLTCIDNQHHYPISGFVPRFGDADQYAASFSRQRLYVRKHFDSYLKDTSGDQKFLPTTGFDKEEIQKGISLEVGCGYGRFLDVVNRIGGNVVGIDLSTHSIELAQEFVGLRGKVHLVQCDLFRLPFPHRTFDRIFSIGVLHHTPDTRAAFEAVVPYVRPSGRISIWVYHPTLFCSEPVWRHITTRLPHPLLYSLCVLNQVLFSWIRGLPGGWRFSKLIPGGIPSKDRPFFWLRVIGDFDTLSPKFNHTHTAEEVRSWFIESGLKDVEILPRLTSVTGRS